MRILPAASLFLCLTACGNSPTPRPSITPAAVLDTYARLTCEGLEKAVRIRATPSQPGQLNLNDFNAGMEEFNARTNAQRTTTTGLSVIARQDTQTGPLTGDQVTDQMRGWCDRNWRPGT